MLTTDTPVVRPIVAADRKEWDRLWKAYLDYYETTLPQNIYDSSFARLIDADVKDYHGFIAEVDAKPVGLVHYIYHRHGWKVEDACYLQDLFADPEVRGKGIGRALIQAVYDAADANATPSVYWLTQDFNAAGRKLYDSIGTLTPFIKYQRP